MSLAARLKSETQDLHDWIEQRLDLGRPILLRPYRDLLMRWFAFYEPFETQAVGPDAAPWITPPRRTAWLREDLHALGQTDADLARIERCPVRMLITDSPQVFGTLYVLEGASLGGRVIAGRARAALGEGLSAFRFFDGHGAQTLPRWQQFKMALESAVSPAFHDAAVDAARKTFTLLGHWLAPDRANTQPPAHAAAMMPS